MASKTLTSNSSCMSELTNGVHLLARAGKGSGMRANHSELYIEVTVDYLFISYKSTRQAMYAEVDRVWLLKKIISKILEYFMCLLFHFILKENPEIRRK